MKILIVTPHLHFNGGVESVNRMLQSIFEEDGHQVDYLTAEQSPQQPFDTPMQLLRRVVGLPAVTGLRYRRLPASEYDLVIANGEFAWGVEHPNAVCLFHGSYLGFRDYLKPYLSLRQYLSLSWHARVQKEASQGKYVVAVSGFLEKILRRQGVDVSRVIDNCVDTEHFAPSTRRSRTQYLFVGTYHRYAKGFDVLEELAQRGLPIDCVTDTDPGRDLGYIGPVSRERMPQVYGRYRAVIFPSRFESAGLVPLEAMSCGTPIVMTNVGIGPALREKLPEFVVDVHAPDMATAITARLAAIEQRYDDYSRAARQYVLQRHSWARFREQWRDLARERGREKTREAAGDPAGERAVPPAKEPAPC